MDWLCKEDMYSIPVAEPGDAESMGGQSTKSSFDFEAYEPDEITVTVELKEGKKEVTVPVLKDSKTGKTYLADAKRKILCADQAPFFYNEYEVVPAEADGEVDICDASAYYNMMRVWDYYDSKGWTGPDGEGTPCLVLLNFIDAEGKPELNACYLGKLQGYQVFAWTRAANFGGCIDVLILPTPKLLFAYGEQRELKQKIVKLLQIDHWQRITLAVNNQAVQILRNRQQPVFVLL